MGLRSTTILHEERKKLGLTLNEYCIADSIYHLSNNPKAPVKGWCNQSRENMAKQFGFTKRTVQNIVRKLEQKGLVEMNVEGHLRTTSAWFNAVIFKGGEKSSPPLSDGGEKSSRGGVKTFPENPPLGGEKSSPKIRSKEKEEVERGKALDYFDRFLEMYGAEQTQSMVHDWPRSEIEQRKILDHLPEYLARKGKFRPPASKYLKFQTWKDDPNPVNVATSNWQDIGDPQAKFKAFQKEMIKGIKR